MPARLICASCNPFGERPVGSASLPGASPNGRAPSSTPTSRESSRPTRNASSSTASTRSLPRTPTRTQDVYQWEASGSGGCTKHVGCVNLISSGRAERRLVPRRLRRWLGRLLPHRRLSRSLRSRRRRRLRRPGRRRLPAGRTPRSPASATHASRCRPNRKTRRPARCARNRRATCRRRHGRNAAQCKKDQVKRFGKCVKKKDQVTEGSPMRARGLTRLPLAIATWRSPPSGSRTVAAQATSASSRATPVSTSPPPPKAGPRRPPCRLAPLLAGHRSQFQHGREILRRRPTEPRTRPAGGADRKPDLGAQCSPAQFSTPRESPYRNESLGRELPRTTQSASSPCRAPTAAGKPGHSASSTWRRRRASPRSSASPPTACRSRSPLTCVKPPRIRPHPGDEELLPAARRDRIQAGDLGHPLGDLPQRPARQLPERGRPLLRSRQMPGLRTGTAAPQRGLPDHADPCEGPLSSRVSAAPGISPDGRKASSTGP